VVPGGLFGSDPAGGLAHAGQILLFFLPQHEEKGDQDPLPPAPGSVRQGHRHGAERKAEPHHSQGVGEELGLGGFCGG